MLEAIDYVARALHAEWAAGFHGDHSAYSVWDTVGEWKRQDFRKQARVAIEALRALSEAPPDPQYRVDAERMYDYWWRLRNEQRPAQSADVARQYGWRG